MNPIEVINGLFVGNQDCDINGYSLIIQAAKEPWHRKALNYKSAGAPKDHPEYLIAYRSHPLRMILNLVDSPRVEYINKDIMFFAPERIEKQFREINDVGYGKILVQCNKGESRSPAIALLYLLHHAHGYAEQFKSGEELLIDFKRRYPPFNPGPGIREFIFKELTTFYEG